MNNIRRIITSSRTPRFFKSINYQNYYSNLNHLFYSTEASALENVKVNESVENIAVSTPVGQDKIYDGKIVKIVQEISKLTLLEVADLNQLLKKTLNIPDTPMMGAMTMMTPSQVQQQEEVEETVPVRVQTQFTVKLLKFDEAKKVAVIKQIKSLLEGMNLVQAKKFVESAPTTVKADISKDEAEKLAESLTAVGATCEIL